MQRKDSLYQNFVRILEEELQPARGAPSPLPWPTQQPKYGRRWESGRSG